MTTTNTHPDLTVRTIASTFSSMLRAQLTEAQVAHAADLARYNDGGAIRFLHTVHNDVNGMVYEAVRTVLPNWSSIGDSDLHSLVRKAWTVARTTGFAADPSLSLSTI